MMTLIIPRKEAPVSGEGTVVIPQPAGDEPVIKNTFFFPDIDPKRVRERMRLEQTVAPARLREAIKSGMAETNAELYEYREQKIAAGFTRLADVPADCNFAFFSGLISAQFWAGRSQPKSPELGANLLVMFPVFHSQQQTTGERIIAA